MATLRATVCLSKISGKPEDEVCNVWHFATGGVITAADMTPVGDGLVALYNAIGSRLGGSVTRAALAHRIEFAQVTAGAAGPADDTVSALLGFRDFTIADGSIAVTDLPAEVAVALSFRGDVTDVAEEAPGGLIRPRSRRRGRVFLGPWNATATAREASSFRAVVAPVVSEAIRTGYLALIDAINGPARVVNHVVYSPTSALTHVVTRIHVDDAFDTIRSRGEKALFRPVDEAVVQPNLVP
jgi:hypothetical protein